MSIAMGVGRRVVLLVSTIVLVVGAVLCAVAENYEWHLWSRCLIGIAAGQSEALVPMITQELFFLHERSRYLMTQQAVQVVLTTIYVVFASPIAGKITPEWWYGLGAALSGVLFVVTALFLPETKYERPLASYQEASDSGSDVERSSKDVAEVPICTFRPELDFVNFAPRTFRSDLRLWVGKPDWKAVADVWKVRYASILT